MIGIAGMKLKLAIPCGLAAGTPWKGKFECQFSHAGKLRLLRVIVASLSVFSGLQPGN